MGWQVLAALALVLLITLLPLLVILPDSPGLVDDGPTHTAGWHLSIQLERKATNDPCNSN